MKKNVMMRIASFLLIAVLISTSAISGTYAKYVTKNESTDNARVAKFGVTIAVDDETMFSDSYKDTETEYEANEKVATITVQADTEGTNVVAPGTEGTLAGFNVTGTPEVDVEVTYGATLTLEGWEVDGAEYCPIIFTINGEQYFVGKTGISDVATLKSEVEAAIVAKKATYHTNEDLDAVDDDLIVTWSWPFYISDANDVKDTALGDAAAGLNGGTAATIKLDVSCTITQVD